MEKLEFKLAVKEDLDRVFNMVQKAIKEMNNHNINQWDERYPDEEILSEDIEKAEMYIGTINDEIASIFVLNQESDEEYKNGSWQYPDSKYYVIHRLCVNPDFQNKGIGTLTMNHLEEMLKKDGIETIRLDVFSLNPYALRMYKKLGYIKVGNTHWRKGEFYLMEKNISRCE